MTKAPQTDKIQKSRSWDAEYEDGDKSYKMRVKRYRVKDGLAKTSLELQLAKRYPNEDISEEQGIEMLYLINSFPLLKFGIEACDGFALPLTEEMFWDMPEQFVAEACEAIREVNQQYQLPFSELQRALRRLSKTNSNEVSPENTSGSEQSDKPG
jgi:hypothetical protein